MEREREEIKRRVRWMSVLSADVSQLLCSGVTRGGAREAGRTKTRSLLRPCLQRQTGCLATPLKYQPKNA